MMEPTGRLRLFPSLVVTLVTCGLAVGLLLAEESRDYPNLHIMLDTGMFLLPGMLALMFWDMGVRVDLLFPKLLAISFAVTCLLEFVHVVVGLEWPMFLASAGQAAYVVRPATWPTPAHLLPVGIGFSVWLLRRGGQRVWGFALALVILGVGLLALFYRLPSYASPNWLGITRPTLILLPLLWGMAGFVCWRMRAADRMLPALALMAMMQVVAHGFMLYSRAPDDTQAIVAHLVKMGSYLILLLSVMELASFDMLERIRAERELELLNQELEGRVVDRTAQLESANESLEAEIAVRGQAEEALHESHERTRAIFETALDGIITMDHEGRIAEFNPAAERIFGYRHEEVIGRPLADVIIPPELREQHRRGLERYLATGEGNVLGRRLELAGLRADGSLVPVELSINRMPGSGRGMFSGFLRDITERKRAEDVRSRFEAIIESSDDAIISKTLDGVITSWNQGAEKLFGYSAEEAIGKPMVMLLPQERAQEESDILARLARGERIDHFETVRVRSDGKRIDVSATISPIQDSQGRIVGASKIARDISDRKRAEQKLQDQLSRLGLLHQITRAIGERQDLRSIFQVVVRSLEDSLPIDFGCVCLYDSIAQVMIVTSVGVRSQALAMELAMTEQSRIAIDENGLSRCVRGQLVYEPDISQVKFPFPERLARGGLRSLVVAPLLVESKVFGVLVAARSPVGNFSSSECEFLRQLSEHVALAAHQAQLYGALQQAYEDLRQTQQAVMQQERLRALGQMASGIAHDINNAISPVALYTESLLENEPNLSARAREYLTTTQHAIEDVAATVARMREFYRHREPQLTLAPVNLNRLAQQVLDLTRARWSDMPQQRGITIKMQTRFTPDPPIIMGVESEIREALINLVFNAVDSMPDGGTLTLQTRVVESAADPNEVSVLRYVQVEVIDTGIGMDEETRRRCLEPFFTTKGERGTGLGLAMVYGIVQRHSAEIEIETEVAEGATVRLSFPVPATVVVDSAQPEIERTVPSRLRILVVDDDPLLLKSLSDSLETEGHLVVTANSGQAGIDVFRAAQGRGEQFAIVITDLGMPYQDGRQVASAVKKASPSTPVILLTGWGQRLVAEGEVPPHVDCVLNKPPKLGALREALARLTASTGRATGA